MFSVHFFLRSLMVSISPTAQLFLSASVNIIYSTPATIHSYHLLNFSMYTHNFVQYKTFPLQCIYLAIMSMVLGSEPVESWCFMKRQRRHTYKERAHKVTCKDLLKTRSRIKRLVLAHAQTSDLHSFSFIHFSPFIFALPGFFPWLFLLLKTYIFLNVIVFSLRSLLYAACSSLWRSSFVYAPECVAFRFENYSIVFFPSFFLYSHAHTQNAFVEFNALASSYINYVYIHIHTQVYHIFFLHCSTQFSPVRKFAISFFPRSFFLASLSVCITTNFFLLLFFSRRNILSIMLPKNLLCK